MREGCGLCFGLFPHISLLFSSETSAEQLAALYTKSTPIYALKFGVTNYLVAAGIFLAKNDEH